MRDTIRKVSYFATEVPDKPGEAFRVLSTLVSAGINLLAVSGFPRGRNAHIDVVPDDTVRFRAAARKAGLAFKPKKTGFHIHGPDRPGALADNLQKLAENGINVTTVDAVSSGEGRWGAIIWVETKDVGKAARLLGAKAI